MVNQGIPPLLIYDDECLMCNRFIIFLVNALPSKQVFSITTPQTPYAKSRLLNSKIFTDRDAIFLIEGSKVTSGANAIFKSFIYTRKPYFYISLFRILPSFFTETIYDFIAKNRKHFYRSNSCPVPNDRIKMRFLN